jgi:heterodisulfide reductase subunit B
LVVAPYYGCQCLRPYADFDDPQRPTSMEGLIRATGASIWDWRMGASCCGASHMTTHMDQGLKLSGAILAAAAGADAIATVCPMCQINLEGFQQRIAKQTGRSGAVTVLYLPQLLGLAMGVDPKPLGLDLNLAVASGFMERLGTPV